jgi:hypothetical protein
MIDSGATISVVARKFVPQNLLVSEDSIPVQVANGQTAFTLGTTEIIVDLGDTIFKQKAHVLDTGAFEAI